MPIAGYVLTAAVVSWLVWLWARSQRSEPFGAPGWAGLAIFVGASGLRRLSVAAGPFLGPVAWSGYVLAIDSAVRSVTGVSLMRSTPRAFVWLALLSLFLWLPFEWYNLRLAGWYRAGLPPGLSRYIALGLGHACIWPVLFETSDFILATAFRPSKGPRLAGVPGRPRIAVPMVAGVACLVLPLALPRLDAGEHLLGLVGVGFLLLLDPLNFAAGRASLWRDVREGNRARLGAIAASGCVCGVLADFVNHMAHGGWHSIATLGGSARLFEFSAPAFFVMPAFALQAFAMHVFAAGKLKLPEAPIVGWKSPDLCRQRGRLAIRR